MISVIVVWCFVTLCVWVVAFTAMLIGKCGVRDGKEFWENERCHELYKHCVRFGTIGVCILILLIVIGSVFFGI